MVGLGPGKKASPGGRESTGEQAGAVSPPFGAIVGQEEMKKALLAVATDDSLGGLLLRGEKGTAKSTAVRALSALLPDQRAIADCPYGCPPEEPDHQCGDCREREEPPIEQRSVPLVTLPLGATRERVVGSLSVAEALAGEPEFEPGLLARANRGILYVDEVNLLEDHLVDVLLDAAATGVNRVERDGVSVTHPASFTLIGTMNPEEGDLRPQLRDRFALQATVAGCRDLDRRATVVERALARDDEDGIDPEIRAETDRAREQLREARTLLPEVTLPEQFVTEIVELCRDAGVDGHRGDIATARTARTLAALDGRPRVIEADVRGAAELTLPHRLRSTPFEDAPDPEDMIENHFEDESESDGAESSDGDADADEDGSDPEEGVSDHDQSTSGPQEGGPGSDGGDGENERSAGSESRRDDGSTDRNSDGSSRQQSSSVGDHHDSTDDRNEPAADNDVDSPEAEEPNAVGTQASDESGNGGAGEVDTSSDGEPIVPGQQRPGVGTAVAPEIDLPGADGADSEGSGRSIAEPSVGNRGSRVRTERADPDDTVDAAASIRAAATRGSGRVESRDLRRSVRTGSAGALITFVVDASASMRGPLRAAKGAALELLDDAYRQRDEVALITFAGTDAEVVLPPTDSVSHAARHLKELPSGDRTPLPAGIDAAVAVLDRADPEIGVVVLVTDGRANATGQESTSAGSNATNEAGSPTAATRAAARRLARQGAHVVVVDAGGSGRSLTREIVSITDGEHVPLSELSAGRVGAAVARAREE